jgi:hypothetical protein
MMRINFFLIRGICAIRCFEMFMELVMEYFDGVFRWSISTSRFFGTSRFIGTDNCLLLTDN